MLHIFPIYQLHNIQSLYINYIFIVSEISSIVTWMCCSLLQLVRQNSRMKSILADQSSSLHDSQKQEDKGRDLGKYFHLKRSGHLTYSASLQTQVSSTCENHTLNQGSSLQLSLLGDISIETTVYGQRELILYLCPVKQSLLILLIPEQNFFV